MPHSEALLERMIRLTDRFIESREEVHDLKLEVKDLQIEMKDVKALLKRRSESSTIASITTFLKEVMPPQWWALVLFLLLASLLGIISPQQIINLAGNGHEQSERTSAHGE